MSIDDKIKEEKLLYDINRATTKISALSPGKIDKYEYIMSEEIMPTKKHWILPLRRKN